MVHKGRRDRMRQRMLDEGLSNFAPHELLEVILYYSIPQKDTNVIAHNLINHFGTLHGVFEASYSELIKVEGIGSNTAHLLGLILPAYSAYEKSKMGNKTYIKTLEDMSKYCLWLLKHEKIENIYVVGLNSKFQLLGNALIAKGTNTEVKTYPKLIAEAAIRLNANYIIICHNHPSGNCESSMADEEATIAIDKMLGIMDIKLLDHIIVTYPYTYSMKNRNKIIHKDQ